MFSCVNTHTDARDNSELSLTASFNFSLPQTSSQGRAIAEDVFNWLGMYDVYMVKGLVFPNPHISNFSSSRCKPNKTPRNADRGHNAGFRRTGLDSKVLLQGQDLEPT